MCNLLFLNLVSPESIDYSVGVDIPDISLWSVGEMANVSWLPSALVIKEVMNTSDVKVDISLKKYNISSNSFDESIMLATDLPNSGFATVLFPPSLKSNLAHSNYNLDTAVVAVTVNTSATNLARSKL